MVDWDKIELICLRSFTGQQISDLEFKMLKEAYEEFPEEYVSRTKAIRDSERSRLSSM